MKGMIDDATTIYIHQYRWYNAQFLLDNIQMADGSPCGVLEE